MRHAIRKLCSAALLALPSLTAATNGETTLQVQYVTDGVFALVGPLGDRSAENLGNNATFGLVVTSAGAVLIDPGGSYLGAARIHKVVRTLTDQPIQVVINSGGQDHRWLGNCYFKALGATIMASAAAVADQKARVRDQLFVLERLLGEEGLAGTTEVYAVEPFTDTFRFTLGDVRFELHHRGPAHTPGDSLVWLPDHAVVFTGDIVYTERMLGVLPVSDSRNWIQAFAAVTALEPKHIVPGHGHATTLDEARRDTLDYLTFLRREVAAFMEDGGDISDVGKLDQSQFQYLRNYDSLKGRNAQQVYQQLEWE